VMTEADLESPSALSGQPFRSSDIFSWVDLRWGEPAADLCLEHEKERLRRCVSYVHTAIVAVHA
jgi:hypothetical protein